ncbi:purine/pyrimidine permease [Streptomyces sp. NBC_01433]|uniref:uracil-xanthine permease family protein n=1 Tax=Streptomyces sp. NBC_01433 TaxID=2903864 RepID=UPI00225B3150|nr:solute carrier family 23 protein [Streptomyces sp. NBC_01433]MCX4680124.1 purine/pyrimidine permease [Streptomyces sp. NBC_01433]
MASPVPETGTETETGTGTTARAADDASAAAGAASPVAPVDERLPLPRLAPLAFQHLLAGVAAPVSSVILIATTLSLSASQTASLLSATLVLCGIGALLQSLGVKALRIGARLPFLMLPGGAAVAIFLQVAKEHGPATASGSVLIASVFLLLVLPFYGRLVRYFPPLVMGTTVVLIGINMIKITSPMIASGPGLGFATLGITALFFLLMRGVWRQMSVLFGLVGGTVVAAVSGTTFHMAQGAAFALPDPFPYGAPHFDLLAAVPLLVFALASLAEATGQTVLNSEAVGRTPDAARDVPRISRADAVTSLGAGVFGTSLMVTSAENIGIVQLTRVRSRFVTAGAGVLLIACGLITPLTRLLAAIPEPVVGAAGLIIYAVIATMGFGMLSRENLSHGTNGIVVALALCVGLLPVFAPEMYAGLPVWARTIFGSGVAAGALAAVILAAVFSRLGPPQDKRDAA